MKCYSNGSWASFSVPPLYSHTHTHLHTSRGNWSKLMAQSCHGMSLDYLLEVEKVFNTKFTMCVRVCTWVAMCRSVESLKTYLFYQHYFFSLVNISTIVSNWIIFGQKKWLEDKFETESSSEICFPWHFELGNTISFRSRLLKENSWKNWGKEENRRLEGRRKRARKGYKFSHWTDWFASRKSHQLNLN